MIKTRVVERCGECQMHWYRDYEPAKCRVVGHEHQLFDVHRHRSTVVLPDGSRVTAVSFDPLDPYGRDGAPDFGLYLDYQWAPPWPHDHLDWPDFGVPEYPARVLASLQSLLDRARGGQQVEVGCLGGHGRTGTALACLAVLTGQSANEAVAWVRTNYCVKAVETTEQEAFVLGFVA